MWHTRHSCHTIYIYIYIRIPLLFAGESVPRSFACANHLKGSVLASCSHTLSHTSKSYTPASGTSGTTPGAGSAAVIVGMWPL